ncbi:MAG: hypothetical protein ACK4NY_09085 [Spirosomataceae bacterium]
MKKIMIIAIVSVLGVFVLTYVAGLFLPKQREFVKQAELNSLPKKVFQIVADFENQAEWRGDVESIKVINEITWTEIPKKGTPMTFRIKKKIENQLFEIEIIEPKNFNGYWVGTFEKLPKGTKVVFKEVIIIENPLARVLSAVFIDLDKVMETYLINLKSKLGE